MSDPSDRDRRTPDDEGLSGLAEAYRKAGPYLAASWTLVASVGAFVTLGWWIDKKAGNTTPWFLLLGAVVGMVGGFVSFFRTVMGIGKHK